MPKLLITAGEAPRKPLRRGPRSTPLMACGPGAPAVAAARYALRASWRRGGVVTQRPAKPSTPVRFRSSPYWPFGPSALPLERLFVRRRSHRAPRRPCRPALDGPRRASRVLEATAGTGAAGRSARRRGGRCRRPCGGAAPPTSVRPPFLPPVVRASVRPRPCLPSVDRHPV